MIDAQSLDVRTAVMGLWDNVQMGKSLVWSTTIHPLLGTLDTFRSLLMYAVEHPSRRKRALMNVPDMVARWIPIIKGLSIAHEKRAVDACEYESETHLAPLLVAPVKDIRAFYAQLVEALKSDPEVPFFVWAMFEGWGEAFVKNAPDGEIKHLKTALADEIAGLVEEDVKPDLRKAIAGALQWRSQETLEKVKTAVTSGAKAKMVGRESCLFLQVADECVML